MDERQGNNIKPAHNSGLAKVAVQYSADTLVVNKVWFSASTFVVKIATFAKPQNVSGNGTATAQNIQPYIFIRQK
jgi:hypothetical protein